VAFEDDRDARSTVPDHRHRCFAETRPAPRALAHQEAYCLSSAFPVCPTFQDWARREAAAARPVPTSATGQPDEVPPESYPLPPRDLEPQHAPEYEPGEAPPRRNPPRDWAAPPPWTGDPEAAAAAAAMGAAMGGDPDGNDLFAPDPDAEHRPAGDVPAVAPRPASPSPAPPPAGLSSPDWGADARGLAGSAAYRLAGPDPDEPEPAVPQQPAHVDPDDDWNAGAAATAAAGTAWAASQPSRQPAPAATRQPSSASAAPRSSSPQAYPEPRGSGGQAKASSKAPRQEPAELFGPAWEAPRRYEAYPTLRTRVGLPSFGGIPRLGIAAIVIVLAALFLFLFGPMLLGFGKNDQGGGGGGAATAAPSVEATQSAQPTTPPPPTPHVYVVAKGDTFSKIASKFGLTIQQLQAANPQVKNIDRIKIGDQLTIPEPVEGASAAP
jgi:LysM repeat protein